MMNRQDYINQYQNGDTGARKLLLHEIVAFPDKSASADLLKQILELESHVQLKYEIRKSLNEITSLKEHSEINSNAPDGRIEQYLNGSLDEKKRACSHIVKMRLIHYEDSVKSLVSTDAFFRICHARILAMKGSSKITELQEYLKDPDPRVIATAIECIASLGNSSGLASVVPFVRHENNRVRATAIKGLVEMGDESCFHLFEKMITSSYSAYRDSAACAIADLKHHQSVHLLGKLLDDEVESIRQKAYRALEKFSEQGNKQAERYLKKSVGQEEVKEIADSIDNHSIQVPAALNSDDPELRIQAVCQLASSGDKGAIRVVLERLRLEKEPKVVSRVISQLAESDMDSQLKVRLFMAYLSHDDNRVRANCVEALSGALSDDRLDFFLPYLNDKNNRVRGNALLALSSSSRFKEDYLNFALQCVQDMLLHKEKNFQLTALYCIGSLQLEEFLSDLVNYINHKDALVSEKAVEVLESWSHVNKNAQASLKKLRAAEPEPCKESASKEAAVTDKKKKPVRENKVLEKQALKKKKAGKSGFRIPEVVLRIYLCISGLLIAGRWLLGLISADQNLYGRLFASGGFLLGAAWLTLGVALPTVRKHFKKSYHLTFYADLLFTVLLTGVLVYIGYPVKGLWIFLRGCALVVVALLGIERIKD